MRTTGTFHRSSQTFVFVSSAEVVDFDFHMRIYICRYQNAMDAIEASESKICAELHEFAASIVNTSPLKKGSVVEVAEQGRFQRARVEVRDQGIVLCQ